MSRSGGGYGGAGPAIVNRPSGAIFHTAVLPLKSDANSITVAVIRGVISQLR